MSRECDVIVDGKPCGQPATWFRASPWSKQFVCDTHAAEFRATPQGGASRIPMVKLGDLQFTCDWPGESGDGTCGAVAVWFQDHPDGYHRPLCDEHRESGVCQIRLEDGNLHYLFDPRKVPLKPPPQVPKLLGKKPITMADLRLTDKTDEYDARVDPARRYIPAVGEREYPAPPTPTPSPPRRQHASAAAPSPPSMIPTTPVPPPDPPPHRVKRALVELAAAVLDEAKRKVERWR
jgi:hypothetical protein